MKKILYISETLGSIAGADRSGIDFLSVLLKSENSIYVLSTTPQKNLLTYLPAEEFKKIISWFIAKKEYQTATRFYKIIPKLIIILFHNIILSSKKKEIKENDYDMVFVNSTGGHEIYRSYYNNPNHKSINILRGSYNQVKGIGYSDQDIINYINTYNYIIFVSNNVLNDFKLKFNIQAKNCFYLPNTIDDNKVKRISVFPKGHYQKKLLFDKSKFNIVFVANIMKRKGHDILLDNMEKIRSLKYPLLFHLIGRPHSEGTILLRQLMKNSDLIRYHSHVSNPLEYIYASDLLILLSRSEAMPRVILEAMALGIPCLVSNVDGNTELIMNEFNGFLFDANKNNFTQVLKKILSNKELLTKMATNSKSLYYSSYENNCYLDNINKIIKMIA